ncbi:helix-turn-helix domain-containing protein [Haloarcula sp. 1CSR25-25]|jgi:DNA-binding transcriptional ArsR family regulator|uniref:ArsR/SmtB family transcription factor n=1 Tax=Haloarcula sp. 1CSR25-25 TaxID=2862545 RepID=UPI002895D167|nr:helix-turn-helix domain-containing protein [Haloarcula sp. 1CSR25-25]MDT3437594.1 helix-turn-helix domain-containing protein [Haloarcula sp. 1CSR25-25]
MSLLPSTDDVTAEQEGDIQVLGVDENETANVFEALSSETARRILTAIYDDPAPPSELAARLDLSLQNVSYHLDNLEDAGVVRVADTRYSEKGKEMNVYAPADEPVVVFVGTTERKTGFLDLLKRLVGATGLLFLVSAFLFVFQAFGQPGGAGDTLTILELLSFPGLEFLLGGLFVLGLVVLWWARNR